MAVAVVALSSNAATKIYVCGTKITGTTNFSAGGGTVSYNNNTRELTINNVDYTKSGSSNNGISVDEMDGDLNIYLKGTVKFTIGDADAVLCKDKYKHDTYIIVSGTSTFISKSSGHAGLKLQDCDVYLQGSGTLTIKNSNSSSSANAIKGGTRNENLEFKIKNCTVESNGPRLYNMKEVDFRYTSNYDTGDYVSRSTLITLKPGSSNTVHAKDITYLEDYYTHIFLPIDYYRNDIDLLKNTNLSGKEVQISDYVPAVKINASEFPDANLLNHLRYLEPEGWLTTTAMNAYTYLNISDLNISSLQGLSQFANLKELRCNNNYLTSLYGVPTSIQTLNCSNNKLTSFNYLQNCSSLKTLNCSNNQISSLGNLPCQNLESLNCSGNKFTSLAISGLSTLRTLNVSSNPNLAALNCNSNALTILNVTNCSALQVLRCMYNKLTSLDLTGCSALEELNVSHNELTSLSNIPTSVKTLNCSSNKFGDTFQLVDRSALTSFDISGNPNLTRLNVYNNSALTSLNVGNCTALTYLDCHNNKLTSLDVSNLSNLVDLKCNNNKLTTLNLSNTSKLIQLYASVNQLTSINVQGLSHLQTLTVAYNKLSSLSVQGCSVLQTVNCCMNQIKESGMNTLVNSLRTISSSYGELLAICPGRTNNGYTEANVITDAQVRTARNKRWLPKKFVNSSWVEIPVSAVPGDVNGDGSVTSADVTALYDFLLTNDSSNIVNGDQNGDGNITSADITAVYDVLLGNN